MNMGLVACAALLLAQTSAHARDFGYERFADAVARVYLGGYGAFIPFSEIPDGDTTRRAEGYPGQIWNFAPAKGRSAGTIYEHADQYCNPPQVPAPVVVGSARFKNFQYRSEISVTGEFTVTGATAADEIFKLTAIDAKYIDSYTIDIVNVKRSYLPLNELSEALKQAVARCGPNYAFAVTGVLIGDVTIKVAFRAGAEASAILNIGSHIKANLKLKAEAIRGGTEQNPLIVFSEGPKIFAVRAEPLPLGRR